MKVIIETERLIIRNLQPEDYKAAFKWCGDPRVNKYLIYPLYTDEEAVKRWLEGRKADEDNPDNYDLGFVLKETGELIGGGGLVYRPEDDVWGIGYNLCYDYWGHGYVPEAMNGIIAKIQETRKINILEGTFAKDNIKSQRVMEKLGMSFYEDTEYEKFDKSAKFEAKKFRKYFD